MADFAVKVVEIVEPVVNHPNADRLSLIQIGGYVCIANKLEDGTPRYKQGDLVVYVPEGAVVPEYLLKPGFWNEEKGKGILAGSQGNRVKAMNLRGIFSQGILFAVEKSKIGDEALSPVTLSETGAVVGYARGGVFDHDVPTTGIIHNEATVAHFVQAGDDVAEILGITKYVPPIPQGMDGEVTAIFGKTTRYDFESIQSVPDLFTVGDEVVVTEKLHGTNTQIGYVPGLNNEELFFDGNLYVASKGLGGDGLVFMNNEKNNETSPAANNKTIIKNVYVRILQELVADGFGARIKEMSEKFGQPVRVFGEIYGGGLQRGFSYGKERHSFAVFDIQVGWNFVPYVDMVVLAGVLGVDTVPVLYEGSYDLETLMPFRDGKDSMSGTTLREGIVIKARDGSRHPYHGRKIGKWVSPAYLLKSTGEEIQ